MRRIYVILISIYVLVTAFLLLSDNDSHLENALKDVRKERDSLNIELKRAEIRAEALKDSILAMEAGLVFYKDSIDSIYNKKVTNTREYYERKYNEAKSYTVADAGKFFESRYPGPGGKGQRSDTTQVESAGDYSGPDKVRRIGFSLEDLFTEDRGLRTYLKGKGSGDLKVQILERDAGGSDRYYKEEGKGVSSGGGVVRGSG